MTKKSAVILLALVGLIATCLVFYLSQREPHFADRLPELPSPLEATDPLAIAMRQADAKARRVGDAVSDLETLAMLYQANGYDSEAMACYRILARETDAAKYRYLNALVALDAQRRELALELLQATVEREPGYLPARLKLGELHFKSGRLDDARQAYEAALDLDESDPNAMLGLARVNQQSGDKATAEDTLRRLTVLHPDFVNGLSLYATLLRERGDIQESDTIRARIRNRRDLPPSDPWADEMMLHCYDAQTLGFRFEDYVKGGRLDLAASYLERIEALEPDDWNFRFLKGFYFAKLGEVEEALQSYRAAQSLGGDADLLYPEVVRLLKQSGRQDAAEREAERALKELPGSAKLWALLGELKFERDARAEAIIPLRRALELDPLDLVANRTLSRIYWESGRQELALPLLEKVCQLAPQDFATRAMLGQRFLEKGDPEAAIPYLEVAYRLDYGDAPVDRLLSVAYLRSGNRKVETGEVEAGLALYDRSIAILPENGEALANKVKVLLRERRLKEAEDGLVTLCALQPQNPSLYLALGDVRKDQGKLSLARRSWSKGLDYARNRAEVEGLVAVFEARLEVALNDSEGEVSQ